MTEPLTPADCDLRDFAFMPLDAARLLDSDLFALSTGDEFKAALALWCKAWVQIPSGSLPDDDRVLAHLSGAGPKWRKVRDMALRGFIKCSDGRLYHSIVCEKANEAWAKKQSYRDRSKKGNAKRWGSQKDGEDQSKSDPLGTPLGSAVGILEPPKGEGEGQRDIPLPNGNGRPADSDTVFWTNAKDYLRPHVRTDPGSLVGKWSRDFGKAETAQAITNAQVARPVSPVQYIEKILRKTKAQADQDDEMPIC